MKKTKLLTTYTFILSSFFASSSFAESPEKWFADGQQTLKNSLNKTVNTNKAKNVIFFVGDGMSISTITSARILQGQQQGKSGEENKLTMEQLPFVGLSKTYNVDQQVPDSAGTMSAMMTGIKTRAGLISVDQTANRADCASSSNAKMSTLLEKMESKGYATGIVSTARITHATPAATYAHTPERGWEADSKIPPVERQKGCIDIAQQLINFNHGDGIEVILGGGRRNFLPVETVDPEYPLTETGVREDGRNLIDEWLANNESGQFVWNSQQFDAINLDKTKRLLGLFEPSHMHYDVDRPLDSLGEPSLAEMTETAINMLSKNPNGYFLMVEAGRIDHGHHAANSYLALHDTIALDDALKQAMQMVDLSNTLIIVTADHSHAFNMVGYPTRGNPILGKVKSNKSIAQTATSHYALADDGLPYTTLNYLNGGKQLPDETADCLAPQCKVKPRRSDLTEIETNERGHIHETLIPLKSETHSGEDVAIYATGPWAHLLNGVFEQNYIYHVMDYAFNPTELK